MKRMFLRSQQFYQIVAATDTNQNVVFGGTMLAVDVLIENTGANEVWINFFGVATAAAPSIQILAGKERVFNNVGSISMGVICSAAETTAVNISALGDPRP